MGLHGMGTSAKWECHPTASQREAAHIWVWCHALAQSVPSFTDGLLEQSVSWMTREEEAPPRCSDGSLVHFQFYVPKFSEIISASNRCFFPRDARGQSGSGRWKEALDCMDTHRTPASSSAAAQTGKPLPPSKVFSSAQVAVVGDRKDTLQVQSANHFTFAFQLSLLLPPWNPTTASSRVCRRCANQYYLVGKVSLTYWPHIPLSACVKVCHVS